MHVRVVTFNGAKNVKGGIDYVRDEVLPALREQKGYAGATASASEADAVLGVLSLWQSEADRDASFAALAGTRKKGEEVVGGSMSAETFELLVADIKEPPTVGTPLSITRFSMDPAQIDEHMAFFKAEVLPGIKATPGYLSLRNMVNRQSGAGIVGVAWRDHAAREAADAAAVERRQKASARGIRFGDVTVREIVLADLPS